MSWKFADRAQSFILRLALETSTHTSAVKGATLTQTTRQRSIPVTRRTVLFTDLVARTVAHHLQHYVNVVEICLQLEPVLVTSQTSLNFCLVVDSYTLIAGRRGLNYHNLMAS